MKPDWSPASYGDDFADVYDDWYPLPDSTADAVAVLTELAGGGPVLELGAGTGRLTIPLAARVPGVWALDNSAAMLAALEAKPGGTHVRLVQADMAAFELPADAPHFRLAFAAFNTLFLLPDRAAQAACLHRVAAALGEGGTLVLDLFVPPRHLADTGQLEVSALTPDSLVLRAFRRARADGVVEGQHVQITEAGIRLRPWRLSTLAPEELDALAAAAGLDLVARWGGWDRAPFAPPDPAHVSVFRKRG